MELAESSSPSLQQTEPSPSSSSASVIKKNSWFSGSLDGFSAQMRGLTMKLPETSQILSGLSKWASRQISPPRQSTPPEPREGQPQRSPRRPGRPIARSADDESAFPASPQMELVYLSPRLMPTSVGSADERVRVRQADAGAARLSDFMTRLGQPLVDLEELRRECLIAGVPEEMREMVWKLLCGYLPPIADQRETGLRRARQAYVHTRDMFYALVPPTKPDRPPPDGFYTSGSGSAADVTGQAPSTVPTPEDDHSLLAQIRVDIPRTNPIEGRTYARHREFLFRQSHLPTAIEHIAFVWCKTHPKTGYFQGFSDLLVPFLLVFTGPHLAQEDNYRETGRRYALSPLDWDLIEADTYWCVCRLLRIPVAENPFAAALPLPARTVREQDDEPPAEAETHRRSTQRHSVSSGKPITRYCTHAALEQDDEPDEAEQFAFATTDLMFGMPLPETAGTKKRSCKQCADWQELNEELLVPLLEGELRNIEGILPIASNSGIQLMINELLALIRLCDPPLAQHLTREGVDFMFFAFRWMICLLTRELPLVSILQLWDFYLSCPGDLYRTHIYVCAAFLMVFSAPLLKLQFSDLLQQLQSLPSQFWDSDETPEERIGEVLHLAQRIANDHANMKLRMAAQSEHM